jgi:hypothetical protein
VLPALLALGLGLGLMSALHLSGNRLIQAAWAVPLLWLVPLGLVLAQRPRGRSCGHRAECAANLPLLALTAALVVFLFSSGALHRNFFFLKWTSQAGGTNSDWFFSGSSLLVFLIALLTPFFLRGVGCRLRPWMTGALLVVFQVLCFHAFLAVTRGEALYRDDHPSFIFRLWEFGRTFPSLVNYIPHWNGGVVHFTGVTSGILGLGLAFWPLWAWAPVEQVYTWVVGFCYIGLIPLASVLSLRALGGSRSAAAIAGLLALGVSRQFFLWSLHYGTVGAGLASAFVLPFAACLYRVIVLNRTTWREAAGLIVSACFMGSWAPCAAGGALALIGALLYARRWTWRKLVFLAACGLAVALFFARSVWTLYRQGDELMGHVLTQPGAAAAIRPAAEVLLEGWRAVLSNLYEIHPVVVFLGLLGVFFLPNRRQALWLAPVLLGLLALTGWGEIWKPNLQLRRMAIPLAFTAVAPAALILDRLLATRRPSLVWVRTAAVALLVLGGWTAVRIYRNQWPAQYVTLGPQVREVVRWIRAEVPEGGRVAFAGKMVHFVGRGHVAPLPMLTGREMMSCDYYHFPHGLSEYVFPPRAFCGSDEDVFGYFELFNVTHVMTYHRNWLAFFRRQPDRYEERAEFGGLVGFRVRREPGLFESGRGLARADFNRIEVKFDDTQAEAVLRYAWADGLVADPPAVVYPVERDRGVRLVGVRPNGADRTVIRYRAPR